MKSGYWENLRPFEKRVVVGVAALFFIVMNFLFVFPYFKEWGIVDERMFQARRKLRMYEEELSKTNLYIKKVLEIEKEGLDVPPEDQVRHFANTIDMQAGKSGVNMTGGGRVASTTNQFFLELSRTIQTQSPEEPLVDFLYSLGAGTNSLIRVRDMNLRPDPARQQLMASVTLVASFQKKIPPKPAGPAGKGPASAPARGSGPRTGPAPPNKK